MGMTNSTQGTKHSHKLPNAQNPEGKNLIQICFEDDYNNFQSLPKSYQKYQNPQLSLQMKSLAQNNSKQFLFNKGFSTKSGGGAVSNQLSETESKNPGTASNNQNPFDELQSKPSNKDDISNSQFDDGLSKINSTFFNRKFLNVPQITREIFVEDLKPNVNLTFRIFALTKYGIKIDIGLFNLREDLSKKKIFLEKLYITRLYRKLQYWNFINIQTLWYIFQNFPQSDKLQITVNNKSQDYLRFLYQIGFKLEYVEGEKTSHKKIVLVLKKSVFSQSIEEISRRFLKWKLI